MHDFLNSLPLGHIVTAFVGFAVYVLTSIANPADESFHSILDVLKTKGRTLLASALVTPALVVAAQNAGQLNSLSALGIGYLNLSLIRKATDGWASKSTLTGV